MRLVPHVWTDHLSPGAWDAFVENHPNGWFWHSERWLAYALTYTPGSVDLSAAILDDSGAVVAVQPLIVDGPNLLPVHGGQPPVGPLLDAEIVAQGGADSVLGLFSATVRPDPRPATHVCRLAGTEAEQWRDVRRSYKALIHRAERHYDLSVWSRVDGAVAQQVIALAKGLHLLEAGRQTRPDATWRMMGEWLETGHGVLALAHYRSEPTGFAYAIRWKGHAYWASGATVVPDLQHALQWTLIKALRADGETRTYEVGYAAGPEADAKARGIAQFKAGFGALVPAGQSVNQLTTGVFK